MPRVSSDHLAARREQIITAALLRFAGNGFHATTMADVIQESGLSAGAVYRYFRGKDDLVEAICERALGSAADSLRELLADDEAPDPADAVAHVVDALDGAAAGPVGAVDLRRVQLQAWAEALRAPGVQRAAGEAQARLRGALAEVVVRGQATGRLPASLDPGAAAQVLQALVVGRLVQDLIAPDVDPGSFGEAVSTLLQPVPWQSVAGLSVVGESVVGESVLEEPVVGRSVVGEPVFEEPVFGEPATDAAEPLAPGPVRGEPRLLLPAQLQAGRAPGDLGPAHAAATSPIGPAGRPDLIDLVGLVHTIDLVDDRAGFDRAGDTGPELDATPVVPRPGAGLGWPTESPAQRSAAARAVRHLV